MPPADRRLALLRGINLGGKNKLPMRDLAAMFETAGCTDVRTFIQSGNVLYGAKDSVERKLPSTVSAAIERRFGYRIPILTRTADELRAVVKNNPFARTEDPKALHVVFLADRPSAARVRALDPERSPGDTFAVRDREIYLHLPSGIARTKLTIPYFDAALATIGTVRNWNTTTKLLALLGNP
jgi:uncharacterized protein (DUF1697 family)